MVKNDNSAWAPTVGGFQSDFRPLQLRGSPPFRFYGLRNFWKLISRIANPDESQLDRKLRRIVSAGGGRISVRIRPMQLRGVPPPNFTALRGFLELISRIVTSDDSHFGQKRQFCAIADGGRISALLPPLQLRWGFAFPILRLYGTFG